METNTNRLSQDDDEDKNAISSMSSVPPPRKIHSYSHQLRGSNQKGLHHPPHRQHSLDDIPKINEIVSNCVISGEYSSDDEFYPYATTANSSSFTFTGEIGNNSDDYLITHQPEIGEDFQPLPEFVGSGGGVGMFKVPTRSPLHSARPPCLELRPHPLKETQVGRFLRNIACTGTQLWAGQESGVRFWNFDDAFERGCGINGHVQRGDEDAAPFHESASTSPTTCLMADNGNRLVWSGHKDGKIRSWKMDLVADNDDDGGDGTPFKEGICWQAHKGPVNSVIMSSYGDLWSCSEGGVIKIWTWESMEKSLSLRFEEKHMAALLVERSGIDLRAQVTVNGTCSISSSEVKYLLADNVRSKVWAAQLQTFSLWDGRTKELLRVFNTEGQTENRVEMPSGQDQPTEDETTKVKIASTSKKEKPHGFLQRSRNAIMGAADAVRRVATRGGGGSEDAKRTEALVLAGDGMIWTGCTNGLLIQWDGNGNRMQDVRHHQCAVLCFCTFGERIYIGYVSGHIQIIDLEGNLIAGWVAHNNAVIKMASTDGYIFSLATHGGIRGWHVISPGPLDSIIRSELTEKERTYAQTDSVRILIGSWNVGQGKASHDALMSWLGSVASDVGILVVGLQEVEMGAGFLAMSAAKESVGGNEGSSIGQYWIDTIGKTLDENAVFERMGSRQLAGLLISLWVRKNLRTHVGDIDVAAVPCGFGRAIGNKGGVGLRIRVFDRIMCFINCHLAAHLEAVNRRNADFDHIYKTMSFSRSSNTDKAQAAGVSTGSHTTKSANNANVNTEDTKQDLAEADMVVFFGDFNYRLFGISYDEARDFVSQRSFDWLREKDQLRAEMKAGRVFQGMREAIITFPPTYKFERHRPGLGGYDSGEKKRIPAWCDRVIYRDTRTSSESECSLDCPVVASIMLYDACMDVTESDHKPVRCKFHVKIEHVDRSVRRQEFGRIIRTNEKVKALLNDLRYVPETVINSNNIVLQNQETFVLRITNKCVKENAVFKILCQGESMVKEDEEKRELHPLGSFGFPRWLEVIPAAGTIKVDSFVEVMVHQEEFHTLEDLVDGFPHNSWCTEDTRDKEAVLMVNVQGSCSTETVSHKVHVRHVFSPKALRMDCNSQSTCLKKNEGDSKTQSSKKNEGDSCSKSQKKNEKDSKSKSKKNEKDSSSKSQKKNEKDSKSKSQKKNEKDSSSKSQKKNEEDSNSKSHKKSEEDSNTKSHKKNEEDSNTKSQKNEGDSNSKSHKKNEEDFNSKSHKKNEEDFNTKSQKMEGDSKSKSQIKNEGDSCFKSQKKSEEDSNSKSQKKNEGDSYFKSHKKNEEDTKLQKKNEGDSYFKSQKKNEGDSNSMSQKKNEEDTKIQKKNEGDPYFKSQKKNEEDIKLQKKNEGDSYFKSQKKIEDTKLQKKNEGDSYFKSQKKNEEDTKSHKKNEGDYSSKSQIKNKGDSCFTSQIKSEEDSNSKSLKKNEGDSYFTSQKKNGGDSYFKSEKKNEEDSTSKSEKKKEEDSYFKSQKKNEEDTKSHKKNEGDSSSKSHIKNEGDSYFKSHKKNEGDFNSKAHIKIKGDSSFTSQKKTEGDSYFTSQKNNQEDSYFKSQKKNEEDTKSQKKNEGDSNSKSQIKNEGDSYFKLQKKSEGDSSSKPQKKNEGDSYFTLQKKNEGDCYFKSQMKNEEDKKSQKRNEEDSNSKSYIKNEGDSYFKSHKKNEGDTMSQKKNERDSNSKLQIKNEGDSCFKSQNKSEEDSNSKSHKKNEVDSYFKSQKKNEEDTKSHKKNEGDCNSKSQIKNKGDSHFTSHKKNEGDSYFQSQKKNEGDSDSKSQIKNKGDSYLKSHKKNEGDSSFMSHKKNEEISYTSQKKKEGDFDSKSQNKKEEDSTSKSEKKKEGDSYFKSHKKNEEDYNSKSQIKNEGDFISKSQIKNEGDFNSKSQIKNEENSYLKSQKKNEGDSYTKSHNKNEEDYNSKSQKKNDGDSYSKSQKKSEEDSSSKSQKKNDLDSSSKSQKKNDADSSSKSQKKYDAESNSKSHKKNEGDSSSISQKKYEESSSHKSQSGKKSDADSSSYKSQSGNKNSSNTINTSTREEIRNSHNKR